MNNYLENSTKKMVAHYEANKSSGYVAKGFKKDVNDLLELYQSMKTLKYQDFCQAWKNMHFSYIYCGRSIKSEVREFTEEVLHTTTESVININNEFSKRIGALYLLYGLYSLQPIEASSKIRMTSENFQIYLNLIAQLRNCEQLDALYIGCKLIVIRSFYFVLTPHNYGLHRSFRKYHDQTINIFNVDTFSLATQIENITIKSGLINALNQLNEKYYQAKCILPGAVGFEPEESLKLVDPNIGNKLLENLEMITAENNEPSTSQLFSNDEADDKKKIGTQAKRESIKKRRQLIRQKAFATKTGTQKQITKLPQMLSPKKRKKKPKNKPNV